MKFKGLISLVIFLLFGMINAAQAQTVVNANDRGWYNASGSHNPGNNNSFTGEYLGTTYRSYFRFTIPAGVSCVSSATLEIELENYWGDGSAHTASVFDVTPVHVPLLDTTNGSGSGVAIHGDLATGSAYGTQAGLTSADVGSVLNFTLPAAALTNIASASGSDFAVGMMTIPGGGGALRALRYSAGNENRIHRLTYTECPALPEIEATKTVEVYDPLALGLYHLPGNDVVYTIEVANSGVGIVDLNTIFLTDEIPANTIFYNGDIDDGGPEVDPVSFSESGSGLTFTYATDVAFSDDIGPPVDFAACDHSPALGYDATVTYICFNPKGIFQSGSSTSEFSLSFRVRIE